MLIKSIKRGSRLLIDPQKGLEQLNKLSFESVVGNYMWLLIAVAIAASITNLLFSVGKAVFYDLSVNIDIQYWRMLNYSLGRAFSLLFFYIFAGTFLIFFISMLLRPFFRKIKYTDFLRIISYSLTPLLLFAWLPFNQIPLVIWSIFLFVFVIRSYKSIEVKKGSVQQRD